MPDATGRRLLSRILLSPRDLLSVSQELAGELLGGVGRKPHDGIGALLNGTRCVSASHIRAHPAGTHGVDGNVWKGCCEETGHCVERGLGEAIRGGPCVHAVTKLPAAARYVDNARRIASREQRQEGLRHKQRAERVRLKRLVDGLGAKLSDCGVFFEEDSRVIDEHIKMARDLGDRMHSLRDALGIGHVERDESRDCAILSSAFRSPRVRSEDFASRQRREIPSRPAVARLRIRFLYLLR